MEGNQSKEAYSLITDGDTFQPGPLTLKNFMLLKVQGENTLK
jgi:hypothetical protein